MGRFIKAHDFYTDKWVILNEDDISKVEEQDDSTVVYYKHFATDLDGTVRQLRDIFKEDVEYFKWALCVSEMQYIDHRNKK